MLFFESSANLSAHLNFYHGQEYRTILAGVKKSKQKQKSRVES